MATNGLLVRLLKLSGLCALFLPNVPTNPLILVKDKGSKPEEYRIRMKALDGGTKVLVT